MGSYVSMWPCAYPEEDTFAVELSYPPLPLIHTSCPTTRAESAPHRLQEGQVPFVFKSQGTQQLG